MSPALERQPIAAIPPAEVDKICAGEVVERPLSVVKELIENALDAGACEVSVELEDGGRRLIRVCDDGDGIPPDELPLALKPHHTSKLRSLADLQRLSTLGFRGEALSSIAAVSKVALSSRFDGGSRAPARGNSTVTPPVPSFATGEGARGTTTEILGHRIEVHGGALISSGPCNLRQGTAVEVRDLFYNVPARLKFLRSAQSESAQVSGLLTTYALAYPEVQWTLTSGGRTLLRSDGDGDLHAVLMDLLGPDLAADLTSLDFEYPPFGASGYISAPHRHWHNRTRQWFLVNRRPVGNKLLYKAVDDAMREFVSPGKFPAGVFLLDLPPEEIDVNVHPAKTEVAFAQPEAVYSLLLTAVRRALGQAAAGRQRSLTQGLSLAVAPVAREFRDVVADTAPLLEFSTAVVSDPELDVEASAGQRAVPVYEMGRAFVVAPARPEATAEGVGRVSVPAQDSNPTASGDLPTHGGHGDPPHHSSPPDDIDLTAIGAVTQISQVADTYLVLVTAAEVYLVDQHSAHERVLFEELWQRINGAVPTRQMLLLPQVLKLAPAEAALAEHLLPELASLGFAAELQDTALHITEVPALMAGRITPELLGSSITEMATVGGASTVSASSIQNVIKNFAATLACKAAVKAGQRLPDSERVHLVELICSRWSSLSCPHGRPTVIRLGPGELEKLFLRT